ncbi:MAG: ThuA domain-containing protein [Verrucomicrobia bacterium]|jgi:uncharacterized protein|nr:ThuA domain-containing protein [Verrucomicrobiota bacterium]
MKSLIYYLALIAVAIAPVAHSAAPMKALIIDGQNNHGMWPKTTVMMKKYLEDSGLFTVDVKRTAFTWQGADLIPKFPVNLDIETTALKEPKPDPNYAPDFSKYDVVLSNFGWKAAPWPDNTKKGLEDYVSQGGGLVIIHAADNSFAEWDAYNQMIGLGGWGGRNEASGPYVYYDDHGHLVRDTSAGKGGSHGKQHEYLVVTRDAEHPITKGLPSKWLHAQDELYDRLRGPAEKMHVLATAYADKSTGGSGRHEPMLMTIQFGSGRVFHTPMGHADYSMECVGFITTLVRGTEWAASGKVTQTKVPKDFPTATEVRQRKFD